MVSQLSHNRYGEVRAACNHFIRGSLDDIINSLKKTIDGVIESSNKTAQNATCFVCGAPLKIEIRGRRKYCAHCGCYLPDILYDHRFTELVKPMDSVKPSRLGTVYTH